jgi:DNA repair protein RadC
MKYRGEVHDRMKFYPARVTNWHGDREKARILAEGLARKYYGDDTLRYNIEIVNSDGAEEVREAVRDYSVPVYRVCIVKDSSVKMGTDRIINPREVSDLLTGYLEGADREHFVVVMLDTKGHVIGINTVSVGCLNSTIVHPREIFKPAILSNASAVILGHNHPSGDPDPSNEDVEITRRLIGGGKILGIDVRDHIIIGDGRYMSFRERGLM